VAARVGWGHSTFEAAVELARAAGVGRLALFHHDPRRSDDEVAEIEARARDLFPGTVAAREGAVLRVGQAGQAGGAGDRGAGDAPVMDRDGTERCAEGA
jgi:hypothetical protein